MVDAPASAPRPRRTDLASGCAVLLLFLGVPALWIALSLSRPWFTHRYGPLVEEVLAAPVPDKTGDLHSFFVDGTVARYVPVGTNADLARKMLEDQGFTVDVDSIVHGGFVDQGCPECTGELEGRFEEGRFRGNQVIRVWLGIERGRVRYIKGRRSDRPPPIML